MKKLFPGAGMVLLLVCCAAFAQEPVQSPSDKASTVDPLEEPLAILNLRATEGAAAGYVEDKACRTCHVQIYDSYQHVGMAQSFARPAQAKVIEDFGKTFYHEESQRYYRIDKEGENLTFHRYMKDAAGKPIHQFEMEINWVLGSGNRARSYLYQTDWGELYMLPIGWYSEDRIWEMSPGFEFADQLGVLRRVQRQCMFCHNALPEVPKGNDFHWSTHDFPKNLPQGTGCQRCHGPGADHIRAVLRGKTLPEIHAKIVNPAKLPAKQRDSVCFQCHMLPAVTMVGSRRFDVPDYSFRPGQLLSDYLVHMEIESSNHSKEDFFEINHHGYRFWQSDCYQKSDGALACISCHNPHVKPESKAFRQKVSGVCRDCHADLDTSHKPALTTESDCTPCHMPTRRTLDVIHVTMTDHRIARGPFDHEALTAPITKDAPEITNLKVLPFGNPPEGELAEIYRIAAVFRNGFKANAAPAMANLLSRNRPKEKTPYLDFAQEQLKLREYRGAEETMRFLLAQDADFFPALDILGAAQLSQGKRTAAIATMEKSLAIKETPKAHYNLGLAHYVAGNLETALSHLNQAVDLRPNFFAAWVYRGRVYKKRDQLEKARDQFIRALQIEPDYTAAYVELIPTLRKLGESKEAERYLAVAKRVADNPAALVKLEGATAED